MSVKEKPFFDATSRPGPLPNFLFGNPVAAGFFAMILCAFFGAVFVEFILFGPGDGTWLGILDTARVGAAFAMLIGFIALVFLAFSAPRSGEDRKPRLLFVVGGFLGLAALIAADVFVLERLRSWLGTLQPAIPSR